MNTEQSREFDTRAYCEAPDEYRLDDDGLRVIATTPGRWSRPLAREVLDLRTQVAALKLRLEPVDSPNFEALIAALGIDMTDPREVLAEKVVQQRERIRELEAEHDPGKCFHCDRCRDADDSQQGALRARITELEAALAKANSAAGNLLGAAITFVREADQMPTEPDAYVAVKRYFAVSADGPEWKENAKVFPAGDDWAVEREEFAAEGGWEFLPIVADGNGTRAVPNA